MHYIKVKTVNEILLESIKEITNFAKEEKQKFLKLRNKLSYEKREEKYQGDKKKLEKQIQYFEEIESYHQIKVDTDKFLKMIEKYTDIEELIVPRINEYMEKV